MAESTSTPSTSQTTPQQMDEFKYFKEFSKLAVIKKREKTSANNIWLWTFMNSSLRCAETALLFPPDKTP